MKTSQIATLFCPLVLLGLLGSPTLAQDRSIADAARKTLQTYEKAVITLAAVIKIEAKGLDGLDREQKTQCVAQIIDSNGLAVTALSNLSPQSTKIRVNRGGTPQTVEIDCQVQEVKYRLTDGSEVPARVVLKDPDLDVAFLAPMKPLDEQTLPKIAAIPCTESTGPIQILDDTFIIGRMPEDFNYRPILRIGRIEAVLTTPRTCYLNSSSGVGTVVFDRNGKMVGLLCRCVSGDGSESRTTRSLSLILPAAEIVKLLPQVKDEMNKLAEEDKKAEAEKKRAAEKKTETEKKADADKMPQEEKKAAPSETPATKSEELKPAAAQ